MSVKEQSIETDYIPEIFWAQTSEIISLKIILNNCQDLSIDNDDQTMTFKTYSNNKNYYFKLELFKLINDLKYNISGRNINIFLTKKESEWWDCLQTNKLLKTFIKVDWDKWKDEDEDEDNNNNNDINPMQNMMGMPPGFDMSSLGDMSNSIPGMQEMMQQSQNMNMGNDNEQEEDDDDDDDDDDEDDDDEEDTEINQLNNNQFKEQIDSVNNIDQKQMSLPDYEIKDFENNLDKEIVNEATEVELNVSETVDIKHSVTNS